MTLYLSGPMAGVPGHNVPLFTEATAVLRREGHSVLSPHEISPPGESRTWEEALRRDLIAMLKYDDIAIVLLPGWSGSRGAKLELYVAVALNFPVFYYLDGRLVKL